MTKEGFTRIDTTGASIDSLTAPTAPKGYDFNINNYVWVKLRPKGKALLAKQDAEWSRLYAMDFGHLAVAEKQEAENDGWSRWQLWSLIERLGPALHHGSDLPFETTIRLEAQ